ncbi:hypothetical protein, partial [Alistipes sp.]|uniref:hypothetical protein n=1 Tax=Alistipes sp. TaxID=1872444 RepID=UPI0028733053
NFHFYPKNRRFLIKASLKVNFNDALILLFASKRVTSRKFGRILLYINVCADYEETFMGIVACRTAFFVRQPRYGRYGEAGFPAGEKDPGRPYSGG